MQNRITRCVDFFFNKLENRYTSIHLDDNWYAKVPFIQWLSRCCTLQLSEVRWRGEEVYQIKSQPWRTHLSVVCLYSITMNVQIVLVLLFPLLFSLLPRVCHFRLSAQNFHWLAVPKCRLLRQSQGLSYGLSYAVYRLYRPHKVLYIVSNKLNK